jgi:L-iditol 2-dehydrogenase
MKAARLHAAGDIRLHDEPEPEPGPGEELVRVTAVGLCGSDRHWFMEGGIGDSVITRPIVPGHEIGGVIASGPRRGQRVAVDPHIPCGVCELCRHDQEHLCPQGLFAGHGAIDGGIREVMSWPAELLVPVPDSIGDAEVALLEPLGIALHAADLGKLRPGMRVGVFGTGPIGLLLIQVALARGASLVAVTESLAHRLEAALALGGEVAKRQDWPDLDVVFEAAGDDGALEDAIAAVKPAGRVVQVGIPSPDRTTFPAALSRRKGLTLLVSRRMRARHFPEAAQMTASGQVNLEAILSACYPIARVGEAFDALTARSGLKLVVQPSV